MTVLHIPCIISFVQGAHMRAHACPNMIGRCTPAKHPQTPSALLPPFRTAANAVTCTASVGSVQPPAGEGSLFWAAQDHQAPASVNRWTSSRGRPDLRGGLFSFALSSVTQISSFVLFPLAHVRRALEYVT